MMVMTMLRSHDKMHEAQCRAAPKPASMSRLARVLTATAVAFAALLSSASGAFSTLGARDVPLEVGAPLHLDCGVSGHHRHCLWETEDGRVFQVEDVHAGRHAGLRVPDNVTHNQCGIVVDQARAEDAAAWTCTVFLQGEALTTIRNVGGRSTRGTVLGKRRNAGKLEHGDEALPRGTGFSQISRHKGTHCKVSSLVACEYPFEAVGGGCFYFSENVQMTWGKARDYCQNLADGADLAVADDCHVFQELWSHVALTYGESDQWLGATDQHQEGMWVWVDGTAVTLGTPLWAYGEPNNAYDYEHCLKMYAKAEGYFTDVNCTYYEYNFICQDPSSQPLW